MFQDRQQSRSNQADSPYLLALPDEIRWVSSLASGYTKWSLTTEALPGIGVRIFGNAFQRNPRPHTWLCAVRSASPPPPPTMNYFVVGDQYKL